MENIEYNYPIQNHQLDQDRLDELMELMVDTVCSCRETIRIVGNDYPAKVVNSRFLKLGSSHIVCAEPEAGEHHLCPQHQEIPAIHPV